MTEYRLLERLDSNREWLPDGVAYMEGELCLLHRLGQTIRLRATSLNQLGDEDFPYERDKQFRWAPIRGWDQPTPFSPESLLQSHAPERGEMPRPLYTSHEQMPPDIREYLENVNLRWQEQQEQSFKQLFVDLYNSGRPPFRILVEALWRRWTDSPHGTLPFFHPQHNVALLLYARVFGLPVHTNTEQVEYLDKHSSFFASVIPPATGYGARAALSENVLATLDSPVMHAWQFQEEKLTQRIIVVGKGLGEYGHQVFSNALITAMRVQASDSDILNEGLISIERRITPGQDPESGLHIHLPVMGVDAPLADAQTSEAAMREFNRQLEALEAHVGFVEVHTADINEIKSLQRTFGRLAKETLESDERIVWAPSRSTRDSDQEIVTIQPLLMLTRERDRTGPRGATPPVSMSLSPELLSTELWNKLFKTYYQQVVEGIHLDAKIRQEFYERKKKALRSDKEQWDRAAPQLRLDRWGPTVTLNQRFDNETGLTIWLRPPERISTEKFYVEHAPFLIRSYEEWAQRMSDIVKSLEVATTRPDRPFFRLITTRLFDAALRRCELEQMPGIQNLYREWAGPLADLLCFEWRKKISSLRGNPDDLFTTHTTFNLRLIGEAVPGGLKITRVEMVPYTLVDMKRSVALFDRSRRFVIVNDPSDFPEQGVPRASHSVNELLKEYKEADLNELAEQIRKRLIDDPRQVCQEIMRLLKPRISDGVLSEDSEEVRKAYHQGVQHSAFLKQVSLADFAMDGQAIITTRESLDAARRVMPEFLERWRSVRAAMSKKYGEQSSTPILEAKELECRLHLLTAVAECFAVDDCIAKDDLPKLYRSPQTAGKQEIRAALAAAHKADATCASKWIEHLSSWDIGVVYSELIRDLPTEAEITEVEEHGAMRVFDVVELVNIAKRLRQATASLSHVREKRAAALVKLGPALEAGFLSVAAQIVHGELMKMLQLLTGRQITGSGSQL